MPLINGALTLESMKATILVRRESTQVKAKTPMRTREVVALPLMIAAVIIK
jgi:hypothetical protein